MLHHKSTRTSSALAFCRTKKAVSSLALAFVLSAVFTSSVTAKESKQAKNLETLTQTHTIEELQSLMLQGKLTSSELTHFYINKIKKENSKYNAVIALNEKAIDIAANLDARIKEYDAKTLPALYGMPILLKDNIESKEMATTAGSLALKDNFTNRDATLTANLRAAGAIILGKTNLSEWANFRSERSSSGWSAIGGQTKNPHDVSRTPCGSSSGSGAAVAANFAIAAIGTETNGSITCPAAVNGVVGVKPTVGLVSRHGVVPISPSQDTAGPMTKFVADAKRVLFAMQGKDQQDKHTLNKGIKKVAKNIAILPVDGLKLGIVYSSAESHEQVAQIMKNTVAKLNANGVELTSDLKFEGYDGFWADAYTQLLREFKTSLNHYFSSLPNDVPDEINTMTLEKLIQFNKDYQQLEMAYFQQEIFEKSQVTEGMKTQKYKNLKSKLQRVTGKENITKLIDRHDLDALIAVTRGPAWKIDKINGDNSNGGVSSFSAISGYPHVTIPMAKLHGLPIGLSIMTKHGEDEKALNVAEALAQLLTSDSE